LQTVEEYLVTHAPDNASQLAKTPHSLNHAYFYIYGARGTVGILGICLHHYLATMPCTPCVLTHAHWELKNGQQCWIEKAGGDIWVCTTKELNSDTQLRVKINRFPKDLSLFRVWQVLRER